MVIHADTSFLVDLASAYRLVNAGQFNTSVNCACGAVDGGTLSRKRPSGATS
jgi:hypothetical protein